VPARPLEVAQYGLVGDKFGDKTAGRRRLPLRTNGARTARTVDAKRVTSRTGSLASGDALPHVNVPVDFYHLVI
jgi:hypothetical protein